MIGREFTDEEIMAMSWGPLLYSNSEGNRFAFSCSHWGYYALPLEDQMALVNVRATTKRKEAIETLRVFGLGRNK